MGGSAWGLRLDEGVAEFDSGACEGAAEKKGAGYELEFEPF
jgi:hypothetical protein